MQKQGSVKWRAETSLWSTILRDRSRWATTLSIVTGSINVLGINPMQALVYAAAINGVVAVPVLALVLLVSNNPKIMGPYANRRWVRIVGWATFAIMALAAISAVLAWKP